MKSYFILFFFLLSIHSASGKINDSITEIHLKNIKQLTFGGDNAEAYFSFDSKSLSFQSNNPAWGLKCDQIFAMDIKVAYNTYIDYWKMTLNLQELRDKYVKSKRQILT